MHKNTQTLIQHQEQRKLYTTSKSSFVFKQSFYLKRKEISQKENRNCELTSVCSTATNCFPCGRKSMGEEWVVVFNLVKGLLQRKRGGDICEFESDLPPSVC